MRVPLAPLGLGAIALIAGIHFWGPNHIELRLLALMGVEVPGLDLPLTAIPNQVAADGTPQVLVYGPSHCPPAQALMTALETEGIPYLFRDAGMGSTIDQAELGAVILATDDGPSESTAIVLVNGKILDNPTLESVRGEYQRAIAKGVPAK